MLQKCIVPVILEGLISIAYRETTAVGILMLRAVGCRFGLCVQNKHVGMTEVVCLSCILDIFFIVLYQLDPMSTAISR